MSKIFGGQKQQTFIPPAAVAVPPPAVDIAPAPITEVASGTGAAADSSTAELRKKYRPSKGIGSSGTGLSV